MAREFWLQTDNKDIQTFEYLASGTQHYDDDIHVIEKSAMIGLENAVEHQGHMLVDLEKALSSANDKLRKEKAKYAKAVEGLNYIVNNYDASHVEVAAQTLKDIGELE